MRILVTGGAGFIGSRLIKGLLAPGLNREIREVVSIDNYLTGKKENHVKDPRASYFTASTSVIGGLVSLGHFDLIYHLGEYSRISTSFDDTRQVFNSNLLGTPRVLDFWRDQGSRLIYAGSSSIFADPNLNPYSFTKKVNVDLIKNYGQWFDLDYAICYFYNVYGEGQIEEGLMAMVIGIFQRCYLQGHPMPVVKPGTQRRDFTHISDVVDGLIRVGFEGHGDHHHIGSGKTYSIIEVAKAFGVGYHLCPERRGGRFDSTIGQDAFMRRLGWTPQIDVIDYIKEWVERNKHLRRKTS